MDNHNKGSQCAFQKIIIVCGCQNIDYVCLILCGREMRLNPSVEDQRGANVDDILVTERAYSLGKIGFLKKS